MIPFEWPFMHRTVAEVMRAGQWPRSGFGIDQYGRTRRNLDADYQAAPRADDEQFGAISDRVHKGGE